MKYNVVTISREFGSGGRYIGEELAKKLGWAYYDKELISEVAKKTGLQRNLWLRRENILLLKAYSHMASSAETAAELQWRIRFMRFSAS